MVVQGNTDIAVADFDYAAAFPWLLDGVPDIDPRGRRVGPRRARRRAARLASPPAGRASPAARATTLVLVCHASPGSQTRASTRTSTRGDPRARLAHRRPGHLLRPHPHPRGPRAGLEDHRQRRQRGLRLRRRPDRLVGARRARRRRRSRPRSGGPSSTRWPSPTRSPRAACPATSIAPPRSAPGSSCGERATTLAGDRARRRDRHGAVSALGNDVASTWDGLVAGARASARSPPSTRRG